MQRAMEAGRDEEKWVYDSSLDHKGRVPVRAATGTWKASLFIIAIEFSERLSYFGIATSLVIYLTNVLHQDLKTAARSANYWSGVTTLTPLAGGFVADVLLGRFSTVLVSTIIYLMGLILLTMSWFVPALKPCGAAVCVEPRKVHEIAFFIAIYLISLGTGGHKPSLESFGADQFDDDHPEEKKKKMSFFNWWNFGLCSGVLLAVTVIVYVQDHVSWGTADIILTAVMAVSLVIFLAGRPVYRYRSPRGSPFTALLQVLVASIAKRNLPYPSDSSELHEVTEVPQGGRRLKHTKRLKFLDKAAIVEDDKARNQSPWILATVTKVEETKLIVNMIPIWLVTIPFGICAAQAPTFFIKQSILMDRKIGNFTIPPASVFALGAVGMIVAVTVYEKFLVPFLRRTTGNPRGLNILQRIGIGITFSIVAMVVAALVERKRLAVVKYDPVKGSLSMSIFWLAPQFIIIGVGDAFTLVGLQEYFYDEVPDSMRSLGIAFYLSVIGAANFVSSLLITVVDRITQKMGRSWFDQGLNGSRVDNFYWLLAAITAATMFLYVFLAKRYTYKNVQRNTAAVDCYQSEQELGSMA